MTVSNSEVTPKRMLVQWANDQDGWVREAVSQVLFSNQELSETQLGSLVERFLIEKEFESSPEGYEAATEVQLPEDDASPEDVLELSRLSDVSGVNALASNQVLDFDPSLTVLFGQNGAGKTGYSRVLKRLAAVRTAEDILPNAHLADKSDRPSAALEFVLNGVEESIQWNNEAGVSPFTRMSVFDSPAVMLHVDSDLNYVFTPREIALFSYVTSAVRHVQEFVDAESRSLRPSGNAFLANFKRETSIYPKIELLGATTDLTELSALVVDGPETDAAIAKLADEVAALRGGNVEDRYEAVRQEVDRVKGLAAAADSLAQFDAGVYELARASVDRLRSDYRQAREELFQDGVLAGAADDEWQAFIAESDRYREHLGLHGYPSDGDLCLYCRQTLDVTAVALIEKYRKILDDTLSRQLRTSNQALAEAKLNLDGLSVDVLKEYARQVESIEPLPAYANGLVGLIDKLEGICQASADGDPLEGLSEAQTLAQAVTRRLRTAEVNLRASLQDLTAQKRDRVSTLQEKEGRLAELVARNTLARHLPAIEASVIKAKRSMRMEALAKAVSSSVLRSLTVLSKQASEEMVNKNFEALFEEECKALRAPVVGLEFQGRRGKSERKKLVAKYRPSAVLSEGEQKVLAIADFLAECRMTGVKAPIVFDDPVTSLDYLRLNEVAQRISRLAESHQVVVFTHNIFFASTLLGLRTSKKLRCAFYDVKDSGSEKGILQAGVEPRQDTPAEIGKRINVTLQSAGTADSTMEEVFIERGYGLLRAWCEAFVEQELLGDVTRRHRANVMMGGLDKINTDRITAAKTILMPLFDRCSRFMPGHSQSVEQLNIQPSLDELKTDWSAAQAVRKEYIA